MSNDTPAPYVSVSRELLRERCPVHPVTARLSLAKIRELDERASAAGVARGELLAWLVDGALRRPAAANTIAEHPARLSRLEAKASAG